MARYKNIWHLIDTICIHVVLKERILKYASTDKNMDYSMNKQYVEGYKMRKSSFDKYG